MNPAATERPTAVGRIHPNELRTRLTSSDAPRLLDVRSPAEYESAHIPRSYNVPLETLNEHRDELVSHLRDEVVLVCRSGMRASHAEQALARAGAPSIRVLDGGIARWEAEGHPLRRGRQRWALERQVRLVAGGLVLAAGLGSVVVPSLKWLATAVGAGLVTAAATDTCTLGALLARLPYNRSTAVCDIDTVLSQLTRDAA